MSDIQNEIAREVATGVTSEAQWPELQMLATKAEERPFPLHALPDIVREAVMEVSASEQAPVSMIVGAALAALSVAAQGHIDVAIDDRSHPSGVFLVVIAESGERKTRLDSIFTSAIRSFEEGQRELMKPEIKIYEANFAAWQAQKRGLLNAIQRAEEGRKKEGSVGVDVLKNDLRMLEKDEPERPVIPQWIYGDSTPEALGHALVNSQKSASVIASEGAIFFGSHGMSADTVTRNIGQMNELYSGSPLVINRRGSGELRITGVRFGMFIQLQEAALNDFLKRHGGLATGLGFFARMLIAHPVTRQGWRLHQTPETEKREAFNRRITALLQRPLQYLKNGALKPQRVELSPEGKLLWVDFYNRIEVSLRDEHSEADIRASANRAAENAARLAALFHVFHCTDLDQPIESICADCMRRGEAVSAWYLSEARRFFNELAVPASLKSMLMLEGYIVQNGASGIPKNQVRRNKRRFNDINRLNQAIHGLVSLGRIREVVVNGINVLQPNPKILQNQNSATPTPILPTLPTPEPKQGLEVGKIGEVGVGANENGKTHFSGNGQGDPVAEPGKPKKSTAKVRIA